MLTAAGDLEPSCGECRSLVDSCACTPVLPHAGDVASYLAAIPDELARRRRVHDIIRDLGGASTQVQQEYRMAITDAGHMSRGDWREALAEAKKQNAQKGQASPEQDPPAPAASPHPEDALDITEEPEAVRLITEAINDGRLSEVFVRGDVLTEVITGQRGVLARELNEAILRRQVADNLPCVKTTPFGIVGALPMPITCKAILALAQWPKVRRLRGIATFPVPLADGTMIQQPGYHAGSGLFLPEGMGVPAVPDEPSPEQVSAALDFVLNKLLADFPWLSPADKANAVALLLTPLLREIICDVFPFVYITAPERGTGKTLLALLTNIIYNPGGDMRILPADEKEIEKTITSALRGAVPVIVFDNIAQTVKSPSLAALLTMRNWTARILGGSRDGTYPNDRLWMGTGNNIALGGDFAQRSVRIAIDYGKPNPDLRTGFKIPDIKQWTSEHRGEVLQQLLILIRAWQLAGASRDKRQVMRGFTPWAQVIGGILAFHGIEGFLANRDKVVGQDDDAADMARFLKMLRSRFPGKGVTARQILEDVAGAPRSLALEDALPPTVDGGKWTTRALGKLMAAHEGSFYGKPPLALRRKIDHKDISWWQVQEWTE